MESPVLETIERVRTPRGDLLLQRLGSNYQIVSNGMVLMSTHLGESERLLVRAALAAVKSPKKVLIGGLGVGYSLAEALAWPGVEQVTVVEIEDYVIQWNRRYLGTFNGQVLDDPRTVLIHADLTRWVSRVGETFDAVCLDTDNGPDRLAAEQNGALYDDGGLGTLACRLAPGGILSVWSAEYSPAFVARLRKHFSWVEEVPVPHPGLPPDYIFLARMKR